MPQVNAALSRRWIVHEHLKGVNIDADQFETVAMDAEAIEGWPLRRDTFTQAFGRLAKKSNIEATNQKWGISGERRGAYDQVPTALHVLCGVPTAPFRL